MGPPPASWGDYGVAGLRTGWKVGEQEEEERQGKKE